jgi:RND family efflux transporter MFP subunit
MIFKEGKAMSTYFSKSVWIGATFLLLLSTTTQAAEFEATLKWSKRVDLALPVSGVIQKVYADVGQKVSKGGKLLSLDDTVFKVKVMQARTNLRSEEAHYKEAEREMQRSQQLYERTVLSDHELQVAKDNKVKAEAERDRARAMLVKARQELKYSTLRAPFNALVLARYAQVGQVIAARFKPVTLFTVADADSMMAHFYVSESQLSSIRLGQSAKVLLGGSELDGTIKAIGFEPVKGANNGTNYPVDVEFKMGDRVLREGQHVKVSLQ